MFKTHWNNKSLHRDEDIVKNPNSDDDDDDDDDYDGQNYYDRGECHNDDDDDDEWIYEVKTATIESIKKKTKINNRNVSKKE